MAKLLFTTSSFDLSNFSERALVEEAGFELVLNPYRKRLTEEQITELLQDDVVGIVAGLEPLTAQVLKSAQSLKVIARCGIGLDNVDLEAAKALGISVFCTPDAPTRSVAELTLAHILSLARRIPECDRALRQSRWEPLMGSLLSHQAVGIVGYGRIGRTVARLLRELAGSVLVYDAAPVRDAPDWIRVVPIGTLLGESDIVTLHVPYDRETHHLISARTIAMMKKGALLVNASRGGIVDEAALLAALQSGHLGGAAIDCFEVEPYSGPLLTCEKVQMSAHMGSYAREGRIVQESQACDALVRGLRQHSLL